MSQCGDGASAPDTSETIPTIMIKEDSHDYFASYTDLHVHEVMLRDRPRNSAYRQFFEEHSHLIRDKVVMDVGAGTGILSLFAASVGARKVYAIEASNTANLCKEIVQQNGLSDKIEVIHSTVEDADLGEGIKVDVMVSEWMGFYLLHESMLDSVIVARDRFLADDGIMIPSAARLYLAPVNMENFLEQKLEFWTNICGFDFSAAIPHVHQKLLQEPVTAELKENQVMAIPQILHDFDLKTVSVDQVQSFSERLTFHVEKSSIVHGFAVWFDVDFKQPALWNSEMSHTDHSSNAVEGALALSKSETLLTEASSPTQTGVTDSWKVVSPSVLSTSPASRITHWKQTVILLPHALSLEPADSLNCKVTMAQSSENKRHYNIEFELIEEEDADDSEDMGDEDDHPVPCDCGQSKCQLIKSLIEKYGEEQRALETEAELVDLMAEVEAAEAVGGEMAEDDQINCSNGS